MLFYACPKGTKESEKRTMNEIYISIRITEYGNGHVNCYMTQSVNDEPLETTQISLDKARKLMWELVLAGGTREVHINRLDRDIVTRSAYIFLPN